MLILFDGNQVIINSLSTRIRTVFKLQIANKTGVKESSGDLKSNVGLTLT